MRRVLSWMVIGVVTAWGCAPGLRAEDDGSGGASGSGGQIGAGGSSSGGASGQSTGGASGGADNAGGHSASGGSLDAAGGAATGGQSSGGGSPTIQGRVVDLFGRPMTEIEVRISGADADLTDSDLTDSQGRFTIEDGPERYDAEFRIAARGGHYQRIYRFLGLTRRDPTLQVDDDVGESEARVDVAPSNLPSPAEGDLGVAFGNPIDYSFTGDEAGLDAPSGSEAIDYDGADPLSATLRALFWSNAGAASKFYAFTNQTIALNDLETTDVALSVWNPIGEIGQIAGHIEVPSDEADVEVTPFLNFGDGASIRLQTVAWNSDTQTFAVSVPDVAQTTLSVTALVRDQGYSWAHADGLALNASSMGVELQIPRRPFLQGPLDEATAVTGDTVLRWTPSAAGPCSLVVINDGFWENGLRIITCEDEVTIGPDIFGALFEPGAEIYWSVQSHGGQETTDAMTGSDGFFDPYYDGLRAGTYPRGKHRPAKGSFARSEYWMFTSAID